MSKPKRLTEAQKGQMARRLVYYCIFILSAVTVWALVIKTIGARAGNAADLSDVLTFTGAVFGGELLMLLVKRIFTKSSKEDFKNEHSEESNQS